MTLQRLALLLLVAAIVLPAAHAGSVLLNSTPGLATSLGPTTVAITPHPAWQPNNPVNPGDPSDTSAVWISHKLSGYNDPEFQPFMGNSSVVSVFKSFNSSAGNLLLKVWADDTADVILDGNLLMGAVFTQSTCSGQIIGCLTEHAGSFNVPIAAGSHTLTFNLYQVGTGTDTGSNPFGVLFTGTAPVPEPSSVALIGFGLAGLGVWTRRRRK